MPPSIADPELRRIVEFALELDHLKGVLRRSRPQAVGRRENSAEHSWHVAVLALVLAKRAAQPVDLQRVVELLLVHDVPEIDCDDQMVYAIDPAARAPVEAAAAARLFGLLPGPEAAWLHARWREHEDRTTPEARLTAAVDRVMPILHNLQARGGGWREHGIARQQVKDYNRFVGEVLPELWAELEPWIDEVFDELELEDAALIADAPRGPAQGDPAFHAAAAAASGEHPPLAELGSGFTPPTWPLPPLDDGSRFTLRPLRSGDEVALSALLADPEVTRHTSIPASDEPAQRAAIEREIAGYAAGTSCRWAIADRDDRLVGLVGFSTWSLLHRHAELTYTLARPLWGRGLVRRAAEQVMAWGFDSGFERLYAHVMTTNAPSLALIERLGFVREGRLRHFRYARGAPRDFFLYARLSGDHRR